MGKLICMDTVRMYMMQQKKNKKKKKHMVMQLIATRDDWWTLMQGVNSIEQKFNNLLIRG